MSRAIIWPPLFYSFVSSDPAASSLIRIFQIISHFTWEFPQQLLGFLTALYLLLTGTVNRSATFFKGVLFIETSSFGYGCGVSLGYIVIHGPHSDRALRQHEFGHCIQSRALGPLYLLLIGVPSFTWATTRRFGFFRKTNYDAFFIERSATNLGRKYGDGI